MKKTSFIVLISSLGTVFEWYDFTIFVYLSKVMSDLFFPNTDQRVSLLLYFTVFILSYLIRPIGGVLFGYIGDRYGRKKVLFTTLLTMTLSTLFIGLIPTYKEIGILAPLAVLTFRLLQGLSVGGEGIGASTLIMESCEKSKSFLTSIIWASSGVGILIASLVASSLFFIFDSNQMIDFGWRLAFVFGAFTGFIGVILRKYVKESNEFIYFKTKTIKSKSFSTLILEQKKNIIITLGLYELCALITYVIFMYMPNYLMIVTEYNNEFVRIINTISLALMLIMVPIFGYLGDIYNSRKLLILFSSLLLILSFPLYKLMLMGFYYVIFAHIILAVLSAGYQGLITYFVLERLDVEVRYLVGAIGYNFSYVFFGAGSLLLLSATIDNPLYVSIPPIAISLGAFISLLIIFKSRVNN